MVVENTSKVFWGRVFWQVTLEGPGMGIGIGGKERVPS